MGETKPIIVADAGMLSKENMLKLEHEGYRYIVVARFASAATSFIDQVHLVTILRVLDSDPDLSGSE